MSCQIRFKHAYIIFRFSSHHLPVCFVNTDLISFACALGKSVCLQLLVNESVFHIKAKEARQFWDVCSACCIKSTITGYMDYLIPYETINMSNLTRLISIHEVFII